MSSSFKSHENLLSCRAMDRSDPILVDSTSCDVNRPAYPRQQRCVYGTDRCDETGELQTSVETEKQLFKNLVVIGIGHLFVFSAFNALQTLQSSLFLETGLGLQAFCIVFGCAVISGLYGPAFVEMFTPNWTAVLSSVLVALFFSAFFYPRHYSLVPCSIALGIVMGPFLIAELTFLMTLISRMSYLTSGMKEKAQQKHLRLFLFFVNSSRIWGQIVLAILLHYGGDIYVFFTGNQPHLLHGMNPRFPITDMNMSPSPYATVARPSLCAMETSTSDHIFRNPTAYVFILPLNLSLMLISVFLGMAFLGVATVTTLLDKCDFYITENVGGKTTLGQRMKKVLTAFTDQHFRLWIPLILFTGLAQGFLNADYTRSFVSCTLGIEVITYTMICHGGMNAVAAIMAHMFSKYIPRATMMGVGAVCQAGLLMVLWLWTPIKDDIPVFYIIAIGWGVCQAIWETHIITYLVTTYTEEWQAPFSAYYMCQWLGLAVSYGWSAVFVTEIKIYILAGMLAFSMILYTIFELITHQRRKEQERIAEL